MRSYCRGRKGGREEGRENFCRVAFGRGVSIDGGKDGGDATAGYFSLLLSFVLGPLSLSLSPPSSEREKESLCTPSEVRHNNRIQSEGCNL